MPASSHELQTTPADKRDAEEARSTIVDRKPFQLPADPVPSPEVTSDPVTEASWESFPASDPPGWIASDRDDD
jgi:hypothetical protein